MNETVSTPSNANGRLARPKLWWGLLGLGFASYLGWFACYPSLLPRLGVNYFGVWFLDSFAILASNDALARGLDVYLPNPLDYFQRPHVYSHWWLELRRLGLTRAHNFGVGLALAGAFFGAALARLRPLSDKELVWYLALLCSSPVLLAIHRANNDLVIFLLLTPLIPCLLRPGWFARSMAVLLIALATGLKFYPGAAALLLLAGNNQKLVRRGLWWGIVALAFVGVALIPDFARLGALLPYAKAEGLMTFGAGNLLEAMGLRGGQTAAVSVIAALAIALGFFRARLFTDWKISPEDRACWLQFVLGAILLTSCFFTGVNFAYRWIFALWMGPFLWRAAHDRSVPRVRRLACVTAGLLLLALWTDAVAAFALTQSAAPGSTRVRWAEVVFIAEQPFTWLLFACLIAFLTEFTRRGMARVAAN
jgi:hypothetical protein